MNTLIKNMTVFVASSMAPITIDDQLWENFSKKAKFLGVSASEYLKKILSQEVSQKREENKVIIHSIESVEVPKELHIELDNLANITTKAVQRKKLSRIR